MKPENLSAIKTAGFTLGPNEVSWFNDIYLNLSVIKDASNFGIVDLMTLKMGKLGFYSKRFLSWSLLIL